MSGHKDLAVELSQCNVLIHPPVIPLESVNYTLLYFTPQAFIGWSSYLEHNRGEDSEVGHNLQCGFCQNNIHLVNPVEETEPSLTFTYLSIYFPGSILRECGISLYSFSQFPILTFFLCVTFLGKF